MLDLFFDLPHVLILSPKVWPLRGTGEEFKYRHDGETRNMDRNPMFFLSWAPSTATISLLIDFKHLWSNPSLSLLISSDQFSSVAQLCPTLCNPMNPSTPGLPVHHQLPEFIQTHVHRVGDAIQPSHSLLSPSPPAPNPSQNQSLFQWVTFSHEVAKVLEIQL